MNKLGKIEICQGADCPNPCCQETVYLWPQEVERVIGKDEKLFANKEEELGSGSSKVLLNKNKSYMSGCLDQGCKIEQNNPDFDPEKAQKGIICIAFPLFIINSGKIDSEVLQLGIVPAALCPVVEDPNSVKAHFFENVLPAIELRFQTVKKLEFDQPLAVMLGMNDIDIRTN